MTGYPWRVSGRCHKFGHDIPHPGPVIPIWLVAGRYMDPKDLVPHLFEELRPGFHEMAQAGDVIVTGRNFGMGPKMNGYIAMRALKLGLVTESMPFLAYRAALGCGLPVLDHCPGILDLVEDGDSIEVDFTTGEFINHSRGICRSYTPLPEQLRELIDCGGTIGYLREWRKKQQNNEITAPAK